MRPNGVTRVCVLGGGNGISSVLRGLARAARAGRGLEIAAIVATADDGGSSGRIRRERGGLPVGDFRNCLLALAPERNGPLTRLFDHRYQGSGELAGHAVGNLILAALAEQEGCFVRGLEVAAKMLGASGCVLPVSSEELVLRAETADGERLDGESRIGRTATAIRRVWLEPAKASAAPEVTATIANADLVVIGPGSLYTSLLSVACVPGIVEAMRASRGLRVLVSNLMTQPGETSHMRLNAHLEAIDEHLGPGLVDVVLAHGEPFAPWRVAPYEAEGAEPVLENLRPSRRERLVTADLVVPTGKIRHDPERTAQAVLDLADERQRAAAIASRQDAADGGAAQEVFPR